MMNGARRKTYPFSWARLASCHSRGYTARFDTARYGCEDFSQNRDELSPGPSQAPAGVTDRTIHEGIDGYDQGARFFQARRRYSCP